MDETFRVIIILIIWLVLVIVTSIITIFSKKFQIKKEYVVYSWEIFKYVTIAIIGYLLGVGT